MRGGYACTDEGYLKCTLKKTERTSSDKLAKQKRPEDVELLPQYSLKYLTQAVNWQVSVEQLLSSLIQE